VRGAEDTQNKPERSRPTEAPKDAPASPDASPTDKADIAPASMPEELVGPPVSAANPPANPTQPKDEPRESTPKAAPPEDVSTANPRTPPVSPAPATAATTPPAPVARPANPGKNGPDADPRSDDAAWRAEKETDPTTVRRTTRYRSGTVDVGEGLETTRIARPAWTNVTRALSGARRADFEMWIDRRGVVTNVKIVRSSGDADFDGPALNALYKWRFRGKLLDDLPSVPSARVEVRIQVIGG
jgi:TonB family protein